MSQEWKTKAKTPLCIQMEERGTSPALWCKAMGLSPKDKDLISRIADGTCIGLRGRSKELRKLLESQGQNRCFDMASE